MDVIFDYIELNYITLVILVTTAGMMLTNRKHRIKETRIICVMTTITFIISIAEYVEVWADTYNKNYRILYYKTAIVYWLYPLVAALLLYAIDKGKYKALIAIPLLVDVVITEEVLRLKALILTGLSMWELRMLRTE